MNQVIAMEAYADDDGDKYNGNPLITVRVNLRGQLC